MNQTSSFRFQSEDFDEDISIALSTQSINMVKSNIGRFKVGSMSPSRQSPCKYNGVENSEKRLMAPTRADHSLLQSHLAVPSTKKSNSNNDSANKYQKTPIDADSSEDSSNDNADDEEEQKRMMDDSYLFNSQTKKPQHTFKLQACSPIPLTLSKNNLDEPQFNHESRGRFNSDPIKPASLRSHSDTRFGPGIIKPQAQLIKMASDPEIEDPELEPLSKASMSDTKQPINKIEQKLSLEVIEPQIETKKQEPIQVETKPEPQKKPIDTKQESIL